jgi:predicted nucleic acid-binding protein
MTRSLVVDASFAFRLIVPGPSQPSLNAMFDQWRRDGYEIYAPALWLYEMTSALSKVVRFGELVPAEGERALSLIERLGVRLIPPDSAQLRSAYQWTIRLNRGATYDGFYLALAEALQGELWTADQRLSHAVGASWVHYVSDE